MIRAEIFREKKGKVRIGKFFGKVLQHLNFFLKISARFIDMHLLTCRRKE